MCESCGCGDSDLVPVAVHERILASNERAARHNREHFHEHHVSVINLMGSPGAGKTAVLEATARMYGPSKKLGVLVGDLATDNDARRVRAREQPEYRRPVALQLLLPDAVERPERLQ